jgi:hypothetical protein
MIFTSQAVQHEAAACMVNRPSQPMSGETTLSRFSILKHLNIGVLVGEVVDVLVISV